MKVSTPNRMAQIPRNRISHQFFASACSMNRGAKGGCVFTEVATIILLVRCSWNWVRCSQSGLTCRRCGDVEARGPAHPALQVHRRPCDTLTRGPAAVSLGGV